MFYLLMPSWSALGMFKLHMIQFNYKNKCSEHGSGTSRPFNKLYPALLINYMDQPTDEQTGS